MATNIEKSEPKLPDTIAQQPPPKLRDNPPQKTVEAALASGKAQVDATKRK